MNASMGLVEWPMVQSCEAIGRIMTYLFLLENCRSKKRSREEKGSGVLIGGLEMTPDPFYPTPFIPRRVS